MATLAAAYFVVWLGIACYVARLGVGQRRLLRALQTVQLQLAQTETEQSPPSKAA